MTILWNSQTTIVVIESNSSAFFILSSREGTGRKNLQN
jgi:hypothetical protein